MIMVDGVQYPAQFSSSQGIHILLALLEHPFLISASTSLKATTERKFSFNQESDPGKSTMRKWVYVFQKEYATVDPNFVHFGGTDEATTCVGLVIRNRTNGMTSFAHMDSPNIVDMGLSQMLSHLVNSLDAELDVHLIGGFEDVPLNVGLGSLFVHVDSCDRSDSSIGLQGYSVPLCAKIVQCLLMRQEKFHIQTICILGHNTKRDAEGNACPILNGFGVETATGSVFPACFDRTSRCPDEIVRRIRVTASLEDPTWNGKLLETYDTQTDRFKIAPCCWTLRQYHIASTLQHYTDSEILSMCSTSPSAEAPDFVENLRRQWDYLIEHPYWRETFPRKQPRTYERTADGGWKRR